MSDPPAVPAGPAAPGFAGGVRPAAHLVVWASVLVPAVVELSKGWRPFGDDAAISSRAYQVFTSHAPLTGLASAASNHAGHEVYGLGPLLFYLLAVPVRFDPAHGLLWGAAVVCGVVLSLAVEAAWVTGRWLAGGLLALAVLDLLWRTPFVFDNIGWNASLPVPFLLASVVFAWLVANGETGWWPVLVVTASVAAQCHLFFAIPAVLLVVVALVLGLLHPARRGRLRWIPVGVAVGLLCWLAPIVQQLEGPVGNLSAVLHAAQGQQDLGVVFALRDLAMAGAAHPLWLVRLPTGFFPLAGLETAHPAWYGGLLLGLLAVVALVGWGTGRALGGFAAVTLALAGGLVVSLTIFPANEILSLAYLLDAFWLVAMALWVLLAWVLVEAVGLATTHAPTAARDRAAPLVRAGGPVGVAALVVGLLVLGALEVPAAGTDPPKVGWSSADVAVVAQAARVIERAIPPGPVAVVAVGTDFFTRTWSEEGVAFRLEYDGWSPGSVDRPAALYLGLRAPKGAPTYVVAMRGVRVVSVRRLVLP